MTSLPKGKFVYVPLTNYEFSALGLVISDGINDEGWVQGILVEYGSVTMFDNKENVEANGCEILEFNDVIKLRLNNKISADTYDKAVKLYESKPWL